MSWTKVAETKTGWKKYRDEYGNSRYNGPKGFTGEDNYNGGLANSDLEYEFEKGEANSKDRSKVVELWRKSPPPENQWKEYRDEDYTYVKEGVNRDWEFKPPRELKSIRDNETYQYWADELEKQTSILESKYSFETYFWHIKFKVLDENNEVIFDTYRNIENAEFSKIEFLKRDFKQTMRELEKYYESGEYVLIEILSTRGRTHQGWEP